MKRFIFVAALLSISLFGMSSTAFANRDPLYTGPTSPRPGIDTDEGMNLYNYVKNDPLDRMDPSGKNNYLETGNNTTGFGAGCNNLVHQQVCVDVWSAGGKKIGKRCFSFGTDSNGFLSVGEVYEAPGPVPGAAISGEKSTTIAQDREFLNYLEHLVDQPRAYSTILPGCWNCRDFSQDEFNKAPGKVEEPIMPTTLPPFEGIN